VLFDFDELDEIIEQEVEESEAQQDNNKEEDSLEDLEEVPPLESLNNDVQEQQEEASSEFLEEFPSLQEEGVLGDDLVDDGETYVIPPLPLEENDLNSGTPGTEQVFHSEHGGTESVFHTSHGSSGGAGGTTPSQEEIDSWENDVLLSAKEQNDIIEQAEDTFADADGNDSITTPPPQPVKPHTDFTIADFSSTGSPSIKPAHVTGFTLTESPSTKPAHAPSHFEPPERASVPSVPSLSKTQNTSSTSSSISSGGIFGILFVSALIIAAVAFIIRRRRRRRRSGRPSPRSIKQQQNRFQKAFKNAERKVVNQHRNLNYRDHSSTSSSAFYDDAALDSIKFTGSDDVDKFHDEGGGGDGSTGSTSPRSLSGSFSGSPKSGNGSFSGSGSGNGDQDHVDFILDSQILQRMN